VDITALAERRFRERDCDLGEENVQSGAEERRISWVRRKKAPSENAANTLFDFTPEEGKFLSPLRG